MKILDLKILIMKDLERLTTPNFKNLFLTQFNNRIFRSIVNYRLKQYIRSKKIRPLFYRTIINLVTFNKLNIRFNTAKIGPGLKINHGIGIIFGSGVKIGNNLTLQHEVTIGNRIGADSENSLLFPEIGNNVFIGCGAKILGPIKIGNNVKIGANAVVIHDIPDNSTAVGIPAKVVRKEKF